MGGNRGDLHNDSLKIISSLQPGRSWAVTLRSNSWREKHGTATKQDSKQDLLQQTKQTNNTNTSDN